MAPDINSLSTSRPLTLQPTSPPPSTAPSAAPSNPPSRRTSQMMGPPTVPASAANPLRSTLVNTSESAGVPLRHPRPLTAAELYLECEKEQEAVVNRLTRELTALRAQSASVASNASHSSTSTSASLLPVDISDPNPAHQLTGATHPTPSRRHRSSSSVSGRSNTTPATSTTVHPNGTNSANTNTSTTQSQHGGLAGGVPLGTVSQASADRAAAVARSTNGSVSRQPSISASGRSTPARRSMEITRHGQTPATLYTLPHRPSLSRDPSYQSTAAQPGTPQALQIPSPHSPNQALHHHHETAAYRSEMEIVKAENESLRQRVRALERALRARRRDSSQSDVGRPSITSPHPMDAPRSGRESLEITRPSIASPGFGVAAWASGSGGVGGVAGPRERSESQSTTTSSRRGVPVDDEVRFGESAGSAGRAA
nr:hypothetical protein CFP56_63083 [Quercus suber]